MEFTVGATQPATGHSTTDPTSPTPSAWRTAVAEANGTQVEDFPDGRAENHDVVKTSFDHGKAVRTVTAGNEYGPQADVTVDLYTNTATVIELDPTTGQKTQYHEAIAENQPGQFRASGNPPVDGSGDGCGVDLRNSTASTVSDQSVAIEHSFSKDGDILPGPSAVIDNPLAAGAFPIYPTDPRMPVEPPPGVQQPFVNDWEERARRRLISQRLLKVHQR
jgi:hypothetical protein